MRTNAVIRTVFAIYLDEKNLVVADVEGFHFTIPKIVLTADVDVVDFRHEILTETLTASTSRRTTEAAGLAFQP